MSEVLRLDGVRKSVGEGDAVQEILKGITLSLEAGSFVAIMGASGSGKSTLLSLVGLLDRPTVGSIRIMGQDVSSMNEDRMAEIRCRSIGFVFQNFHLIPYMTVSQNVAMPMEYAGRSGRPQRVAELLALVGLSHRRDAHPATLSGGERQRVAIARALANEPAFLLADEPTGALDSKTGANILNLFCDLHNAGKTILLITHDEKVGRRAQRMFVMRDGQFE